MNMSRSIVFALFLLAVFLQAGAYGLTFMLPRLYDAFGANEKIVGATLLATAISTIISVYYSGHLSDLFGRVRTLGIACFAIAVALFLFGWVSKVGAGLWLASILLGLGWGLTYSLAPIVMSRLVGPDERVRYFALLSVFVMAGFGLAPVLTSGLENIGLSVSAAFYAIAAQSLLAAMLFFALHSPVRLQALNPAPEASSRLTPSNILEILRSKALVPVVMVCLGASVFAGLNNFQTVFAEARGLDYAQFFLIYTLTVVVFRLLLVRFKGGANPYRTIAGLQYVMCFSVGLFIVIGGNMPLYWLVAILFGLGYGVSYPILVAMAANDAQDHLGPQTLQLFALSYFVGIFGFPLIAGWMIVELGTFPLLTLVAVLAAIEATLALKRAIGATH